MNSSRARLAPLPLFAKTTALLIRRASAFFALCALICAAGCASETQEELAGDTLNKRVAEEEPSTSSISLRLVVSSPCENPCALSAAVTGAGVKRVRYEADGWLLGESDEESKEFAISYSFSQLGERQIRAVALSAEGAELAEGAERVVVERAARAAGELPEVPYFYQYANTLSPGATCQNTSIAMVLSYLGWGGRPDDITGDYGRFYAQEPAGLAEVFNDFARRAGLSRRLQPTTHGTLAGLRAELDRGEPVIIHGYFTGAGHVVVVLGYDEGGYYVNDPAGTWSQSFKGGYPNGWEPSAGRAVYYGKASFERAVSTLDGYTYEPLWYHALR